MLGWIVAGSLALAGIASLAAAQENWVAGKAPLMTQWAKDVSPANALPEYPRPQLVRKDWLNLNGLWDYAIAGKSDPRPEQWAGRILVPFPLESALSGVMKQLDAKSRLWYRRSFTVPAGWKGQRVLLHFGAVDWEAAVWVNGKQLGLHRGGYDAFSFDITDTLKADGAQEVVVAVLDPTDQYWQPKGKQVLKPGGIMYTGTSGIWQTVWVEPVAQASVEGLTVIPDIDAGTVQLSLALRNATDRHNVEVVVLDGDTELSKSGGPARAKMTIGVKNAKLWTPDNPYLYNLRVTLMEDNKPIDTITSYFGMRKIAMAKDEKGINRLMLNNKFVFQIGFLDQGFWPDGIYTAPTDAALKYDIEMTKKLGMNMCRKHVKVEPERWYYWCDKLGLLVWQDMPSSGVGHKPDRNSPDGVAISPEANEQFQAELKALVDQHRNHPSIILWVVFNEGWGQYDTVRLTNWVKEMDPSRLVNNASGWTDQKCGDVMDIHSYPGPGAPKNEEKRAAVLGEFGGLGLGVDGHTWANKTWGYRGMASMQGLTKNYIKLLQKVHALKEAGLCAAVYTQTTDVETECNGLMTYDRAIMKVDIDKVAPANRGESFGDAVKLTVVVPTGQKEGATWRYTTDKPADGWFKSDFDAAAWKEGPSGFGTKGTPGSVVRTEWKTDDIWLRREITLDRKLENPMLLMHHDEDVEVYINGVLAAKAGGFVSEYEEFELTNEGKAALKAGKNVIAVHCHQTQGGQYIDVGIAEAK
jgi:hypothetical protein